MKIPGRNNSTARTTRRNPVEEFLLISGFTWFLVGYLAWTSVQPGNATSTAAILLGFGYGHILPSLLMMELLGFIRRRIWWWLALVAASPPASMLLVGVLRSDYVASFGAGGFVATLLGLSLLALARGYLVAATKDSAAIPQSQ